LYIGEYRWSKKSAHIPVRGGRFFYVWAVGLRFRLVTDAVCGFWDLSIGSPPGVPFRFTELRVWDAPLA
jgi:hypothetical protein